MIWLVNTHRGVSNPLLGNQYFVFILFFLNPETADLGGKTRSWRKINTTDRSNMKNWTYRVNSVFARQRFDFSGTYNFPLYTEFSEPRKAGFEGEDEVWYKNEHHQSIRGEKLTLGMSLGSNLIPERSRSRDLNTWTYGSFLEFRIPDFIYTQKK